MNRARSIVALIMVPLPVVVIVSAILILSKIDAPHARSFIVQAADAETAAGRVRAAGGRVTHRLDIIGAAAASLTERQVRLLRQDPKISHVHTDPTLYAAEHDGGGRSEQQRKPEQHGQ